MTEYPGFDAASLALIAEYESHGWTFRVSSRGHAIGRSPDGEATCSIARRMASANRTRQNSEADLRRWLRQQEEKAPRPSDS